MLRHLPALAIFAFGLAVVAPSIATAKDSNELELKTQRVIIFKDGYSLIIKPRHCYDRSGGRGVYR